MHLLDDFRIEELTSTELYKLIIELQEDSIKTKELLLNVSKELLLAKKEIKTQNIEIEIIKKRQSNRQKQKPIANFSGNSAFEKKNKGQYNIETDLIDDGFDDDDDLFDDSFNDGFDDLFDDSFNDDFNEPLDLSFAARSKFKSQGYKAVDEEIKKMSQDIDKEIKKMNQDIDQEFKKMSQNVNEEFKKMNQDIDQEFKKMSQDVAKEIDDLFKN